MQFLLFLSEILVPLILLSILVYGLLKRISVYEVFLTGAREGARTVARIMPTLVGLMIAVSILRASGLLTFLGNGIGMVTEQIGFSGTLVPLALVKLFSSSAATGLLLDIYREYGTDSRIGMIASIMLASTETVFYTMSVYFLSVQVTRTRWTLAGALIATLAGIVASAMLP
ncbi:MAG: spore maturation protein [Hespellia sp.]|nr:spore maturation protein [Hespellia sp.]